MSEVFKVNDKSICQSCSNVPAQGESLQCFTCKVFFHLICENTVNENKLGNNTLVKQFQAQSTKENFKFFCNKCLTELEISMAKASTDKINTLEKKYETMETKLDTIIEHLSNEKTSSKISTRKPSGPNISSLWLDKDKLAKVKAPPAKSVLVVKKAENLEKCVANQNVVQSVIMNNNIPVVESFQNKSGDLMIVCESEDKRDELKGIVSRSDEDIVINTPRQIRHSITIVGLPKAYEKEEVMKMLTMQNGYIKQFAVNNVLEDHITINAIKPLKNNASLFQVFGNVSTVLREGFHHFFDKVTLGLSSCKVYDQQNVKRCYNCQNFGHYARDCPTKDVHVCGKCSENHLTSECESFARKCINCVRNHIVEVQHPAFSHQCPSLVKQQNLMKKRFGDRYLNSTRNHTVLPP